MVCSALILPILSIVLSKPADYELGVTCYPYFEGSYAMRGSSVYQQTLNLTISEKQELRRLLEENYLPENRVYRYNFFYDNCTTIA